MIDVFLLSKPTPTMGAPPNVAPGDPNAVLPPVVPLAPVVGAPPIPGDEPNPLPVPGLVLDEPNPPLEEPVSVPPVGEVEEPLLPKAKPEFPPMEDDGEDEPNAEPLLPDADPLPPNPEVLLPNEDPEEPNPELLPPTPLPTVLPFVIPDVSPAPCTV